MRVDLDTFLVALYTIVDELYQQHVAPHRPRRRGRRPELSDSEALTLMICEQWHGRSERGFLRFARRYWRAYWLGYSWVCWWREGTCWSGYLSGCSWESSRALRCPGP